MGGDPQYPKKKVHETTLVNCVSLVAIYFTRESLVLRERAHK